MSISSREIRLAARPDGEPKPTDFELAEVQLPDPGDGQVLVRNTYMSVDPYMRGRMSDAKSYVPPFALGAALDGRAIGEVVESRAEGLAEGDVVLHGLGWREHALLDAGAVRRLDLDGLPASAFLGVLGMPGLTAYVGLLDIADVKEDDIVFVSGAAGAVGSLAGQIAKLRGHRVIGSAGSAEKVAFLREELGFDAAFNYKDGPVTDLLAAAAPDGIDVYFDNVGGDHLAAAIDAFNNYGRVALCGSISGYNDPAGRPGPSNLHLAVGKRLTLRGFIVVDHGARMKDFISEIAPAVRDGRIVFRETVVEGGLEQAPQALIDLLRGANTGKMVVKL
jgi:NADPH-dependent curcumin reductase CurA